MVTQRVRDVMTREVVAFTPETSLAAAATLLRQRHLGGAPVVNAEGRPVGFVSASDLIDVRAPVSPGPGKATYVRVLDGRVEAVGIVVDPAEPRGVVADVMSTHVLSIPPDASVVDAARHMILADVHRLLVMEERRLVGLVSSVDVLRAVVEESDDEIRKALRAGGRDPLPGTPVT